MASKKTLPDIMPLREGPTVYSSKRFDVRTATVALRDGGQMNRDGVVCPDSVVVLPLLDHDRIVLIRNHRFTVGQALWELCAGTMESNESDPLECAKREVVEETGYRAENWQPLFDFWAAPGLCTERMHAFVACDLEHVGQSLDANEQIDVEVTPIERSMQMIRDGAIEDGKTIATLLYYQTFVRNVT